MLRNLSDWRKFGGNIAGQQNTRAILGLDLGRAQLRQIMKNSQSFRSEVMKKMIKKMKMISSMLEGRIPT